MRTSGSGAGHSARPTTFPTCAPSSRSPGVSTHQRGPAIDAPDREQVREQLRSGLTPGQVSQAMGAKRVYWLTALEEEARLENELAAYPASPQSVAALRDERQLRWERIAARVFGDARRVEEVRSLYDQAHGPDASSRSYTGRGRRFPEMEP